MSLSNTETPIQNSPTKKDIFTPLLLSIAIIIGIGVGLKLKNEPLVTVTPKEKLVKPEANDINGQGRMEEILRYVNAKYVDNINDKILVEKSINNLLQELDPHSIYIPASDLKEVNEDLDGEFDGIGIESILMDDTLTVVTPLSNSPAANAGLLSGDKIILIGDSSAIGKNIRWLNDKLHGKKGTTVKISIQREAGTRLKTLTLTRDRVPVHSVDVATEKMTSLAGNR